MNSETLSSPHSARWLRLAEYGDWPHSRGLQRFTPAAADTMVRYFKSLRGRMARKFGGLPVYIGHPDDAHFSGQNGHTDTRAYAWVTDLQTRKDGLYGAFKWSAAGEELLANAFYKFLSPRWVMEPLGKDAFQPVRLLSVGLTNQPNIPGDAIANCLTIEAKPQAAQPEAVQPEAAKNNDAPHANTTRNHIPTTQDNDSSSDTEPQQPPETNAEQIATAITVTDLREALGIGDEVDPLEAISELREQSERFYRIACEQADKLNGESASLANARSGQIGLIVENAVLSGRIAPHEAANWQQSLEDDWDGAYAVLGSRTTQLKTTAIANARTCDGEPLSAANDFLARVNAHAKATNQNFAKAWSELKRSQPDLYQQFFQ